MKKTVKSILFKLEMSGNGIVNYDSTDQKWMYANLPNNNTLSKFKQQNDNVLYAKKVFTHDDDGLLKNYKIKISANCLRHATFLASTPFQNPNLMLNDGVLYPFLASKSSLLRGYVFATKDEILKRKSPLTLVDAIQTNDSESMLEFSSRSGGSIKDLESNSKDNSIFNKESIGHVKYVSNGNVSINQLQFISADQLYDRYSINPDKFDLYEKWLKKTFRNFDSKLEYYTIDGGSDRTPEYGILLSNENVVDLVKTLIDNLRRIDIRRAGAYAKVDSIKIKLVYDALEDTLESEDGWVDIDAEYLDNFNFDSHVYYIKEDKGDSEKIRNDSVDARQLINNKKTADKNEKKIAKAAYIAAKEAEKLLENTPKDQNEIS